MQRNNNTRARAPLHAPKNVTANKRSTTKNRTTLAVPKVANAGANRTTSATRPVTKTINPAEEAKKIELTRKVKQSAKECNYECPVCLEFCAEPVKTPCGHFMCLQCQK